ncbi:DUF2235 domain-containing protein [Maribacter sp.]|nr:DUF2235 domain-containing protein [Maribacter sp.]
MAGNNQTSSSAGSEVTKNRLAGVTVNTAPCHVGNSNYEELIPDEYADVIVGVFFDGTGNNKYNTQSRLDHNLSQDGLSHDASSAANYLEIEDSSFENSFSNVARMEPAYKRINEEKKIQLAVYVEGIGTTKATKDSKTGYGLGTGATGVPARVKEACKDIAAEIKEKLGSKKLNRLVIDTYGFSRGSAAARHFVYEVTKRKGDLKQVIATGNYSATTINYEVDHGALGEQLSANGIELPCSLSIRFAGLYETVASYGVRHSNDTSELMLNAVSRARYVFHLVAEDEHRGNFRLTNINEALTLGETSPEKITAVQKIFPGVHSDIGGGYTDNGNENITLRSGGIRSNSIFKKEKEHLIAEGWYLPTQIALTSSGNGRNKRYTLRGTRNGISNKYSYLPLHTMVEFSITKNIDFDMGLVKNQHAITIQLLKDLKTKLDDYVYNGGAQVTFSNPRDKAEIMLLRNQHLHFSSHLDKKVLWGLIAPHAPNIENGVRTRVIQDG